MPRKNPHAVALGRKGGQRNSEAQKAAKRRNGLLGGRPSTYRLTRSGELERLRDDWADGGARYWIALHPPYDRAAREALRRLR